MRKSKKTPSMPLLHPALRIEIEGFNQTRILNTLASEGVRLRNISKLSSKLLRVDIAKKDSKKAFAILEEMCYTYSVTAYSGSLAFFKGILNRIGLVAGLLVFTVTAVVVSQFVWRIDVSGNESVDSQLILRELKSMGLKPGMVKDRLDAEKVVTRLRALDGIAEGTAEIRGTTVFIHVVEEKDFIPPDYQNEPRDITGAYDAEITRIVVSKGTAVVKIGDKIAAGATLIKGETYNTNGEVLEQVRARGQVFGKVSFRSTHVFSATEQVEVLTGTTKTFTQLSLFGLKIGGKKIPDWQKTVTKTKLFFIPIRVTRTVCRRTKVEERQRDIDAYCEALKRQAVLDNVIRAGGSEIDTVTTLTRLDDGTFMFNVYVVGEMLISAS